MNERLFKLWGCVFCKARIWTITGDPIPSHECHVRTNRSPLILVAVCREAGEHVDWRAA